MLWQNCINSIQNKYLPDKDIFDNKNIYKGTQWVMNAN